MGMMGGFGAHEYMAPCAAGENDVALSDSGLRGQRRDRERRAAAGRRACRRRWPSPGRSRRRARPRSRPCAGRSACRPGALIKALPVIVEDRGPLLVVVRGDHRLNEIKLQNALGRGLPARRGRGGARRCSAREPGFIGPVGAPRAGAGGRGAARPRRPRGRRQRARPPPAPASSRGATSSRSGSTCARVEPGDTRPGRQPDPDRARDRGGQHLQARDPLLGAARRHATSTSRARSS